MKREITKISPIIFALLILLTGQVHAQTDQVTQFSTIDALLNGLYDGQFSFSEIKKSGNFGIGTFNALDGEMVLLDGTVYQVTANDGVHKIDVPGKTPFAVTAFFEPDTQFSLSGNNSIEELKEETDKYLISENLFYAIKITGKFSYMKTRSILEQSKPYPPLAESAKEQVVFEAENIDGTVIGFYSPEYIKGINVPGYHLHFISGDKTFGGHILNLKIEKAVAEIDEIKNFSLHLPENDDFYKTNLKKDKSKELKAVEQDK